MKIQEGRIVIEFSEDVQNKEHYLNLGKAYDLYTGAIENGTQYIDAKQKNEDILNELKENKATSITFLDFTPMMSTSKYDYKIDL